MTCSTQIVTTCRNQPVTTCPTQIIITCCGTRWTRRRSSRVPAAPRATPLCTELAVAPLRPAALELPPPPTRGHRQLAPLGALHSTHLCTLTIFGSADTRNHHTVHLYTIIQYI
ncbi:uncharacterized protein LOC114352775 isoform X2 [Ostrinia furnacalis]|uniref:uncharacterized protein LOC114352775 isoform X1 n=1 Tax=Ostrinia furnacalis TaxID=93504 RepID=UPI001038FCF7|nr:uncharacterized protein LOC114352775 isoform X1 [Ostrinia furnacalis]XP_028160307.1 uncharacterized protein LOC114352775 isoform X2 [Ostrinia furnacalis]